MKKRISYEGKVYCDDMGKVFFVADGWNNEWKRVMLCSHTEIQSNHQKEVFTSRTLRYAVKERFITKNPVKAVLTFNDELVEMNDFCQFYLRSNSGYSIRIFDKNQISIFEYLAS